MTPNAADEWDAVGTFSGLDRARLALAVAGARGNHADIEGCSYR
jgi:hypothetical protein